MPLKPGMIQVLCMCYYNIPAKSTGKVPKKCPSMVRSVGQTTITISRKFIMDLAARIRGRNPNSPSTKNRRQSLATKPDCRMYCLVKP